MKKLIFLQRIRQKIRIFWHSFKRKPHIFIYHLILLLFFRFLGLFICLIVSIIPIPLNQFLQNITTLNLSFSSFKDIASTAKQMASQFQRIVPSPADIMLLIKNTVMNFNPANVLNVIRNLPSELRQFFLQFFSHLRQRFHDLKIFCRSLWPPRKFFGRLRQFIKKHTLLVKRLLQNMSMMVGSIVLGKFMFLFIIPLLGIGAINVFGIDISLLIIAILGLLSSQLGSLIGKLINNSIFKFYKYAQSFPQYKITTVFLLVLALFYHHVSKKIIYIRERIIDGIDYYIENIRVFYSKHKNNSS